MKNQLLLFTLFISTYGFTQQDNRILLPGTPISITIPERTLIPKHTSTLFIDSTIEFTTTCLPGIDAVLNYIQNDSWGTNRTNTRITPISVGKYNGQVLISDYAGSSIFYQAYFGDSINAVLSQCIYKNSKIELDKRLTTIVKSMQIEDNPKIDVHKYLAFTFDEENIFQPIPVFYSVSTSFTPNGIKNDSLFNQSGIDSQQFPIDPRVKNSKDLMFAYVGNLTVLEILKVLFDGEVPEQEAYKFSAICKKDNTEFELNLMTFYDKYASVIINSRIIDGKYRQETYDFLSSIRLKKDGY